MKMPWENKTGLAKATAFFASMLGIALGLCGGQMGLWYGLSTLQMRAADTLALPLALLGYAELAMIGISGVALFVIGLILVFRQIIGISRRSDEE